MSTLISLPGAAAPAPDYQSLDRPMQFTAAAAAKVRELIAEEGNADLALRVYIQGVAVPVSSTVSSLTRTVPRTTWPSSPRG